MYANMVRDARDARAVIGSDQCIIDQSWFFIRGCLEIPILGSQEPFLWGLWVSVREEIFDELSKSWELAGRENTRGPFRGRIANSLSVYPETLNLKVKVVVQPVGQRPLFQLEEPGHPLTLEQHSGITPAKAAELANLLLHQEEAKSGRPVPGTSSVEGTQDAEDSVG